MKYLNPIEETARALAFLTRFPVPDRFFKNTTPEQMSHCAGFYPVAGLIIGLCGAVLLLASHLLGHGSLISSILAVFATILMTGALHEDGLGDVADGFGGGKTIEKRLEIMKDSRLGTYGVLAISGSLMLKTACIAAIIDSFGAWAGAFAMVASATSSRGAMVWLWASLAPAKSDGVSRQAGQPPENAVSIAAILGLSFGILFGFAAVGFIPTFFAAAFAICTLLGFQQLCQRLIGGQTGDTIGACQQLTEISFLLGLAIQFSVPN